jgi:hypothetical protein
MEVAVATNPIEVEEVGRRLFVDLMVVPDPEMLVRGVGFGGVVGTGMYVVDGSGMANCGRILAEGVEVLTSTLIGGNGPGMEVLKQEMEAMHNLGILGMGTVEDLADLGRDQAAYGGEVIACTGFAALVLV